MWSRNSVGAYGTVMETVTLRLGPQEMGSPKYARVDRGTAVNCSVSWNASRNWGLMGVNWALVTPTTNSLTRMMRVLGPLGDGVNDGDDVEEGGT
jgi:hypothetical protein